jgi:hypothetical protein
MLGAFGVVANFFAYQAFLTGTYNYRNHELLRMRRVPLVAKLGISTGLSSYMCYLLYNDSLYDEDLYRVSLKYRHRFDEQYNAYLNNDKIENNVFNQAGTE